MKTLFCLFFLILVCQSLADDIKRYDGYKVLRIFTNGSLYDGADVHVVAEKLLADVWAANPMEGWIDVMVSPTQLPAFEYFESKVNVEDVQALLDQNEEEIKVARANGLGEWVFDYFPTHGEVVNWLNQEVSQHPEATRVVLGQTYYGTDIEGLLLGEPGNPLVYIHCGIHAREWITVTTCCWIIDNLLNTDPNRGVLLADFQWVIIPVFNIDGYDRTHTSDRLWRKNVSPNQGSACLGTDINRNYGYGWGGPGSSNQPCSETYRGLNAYSTPEATAERNYLQPKFTNGEVIAYFDIHSYGAYFMSAWGYSSTQLPADYAAMDIAMSSAVDAIWGVNSRTYAYGSSGRILYLTSGGTVDWTYGDGGVVHSYTIEAFGSNFTPPPSWIIPIATEIWAGVKDVIINL